MIAFVTVVSCPSIDFPKKNEPSKYQQRKYSKHFKTSLSRNGQCSIEHNPLTSRSPIHLIVMATSQRKRQHNFSPRYINLFANFPSLLLNHLTPRCARPHLQKRANFNDLVPHPRLPCPITDLMGSISPISWSRWGTFKPVDGDTRRFRKFRKTEEGILVGGDRSSHEN